MKVSYQMIYFISYPIQEVDVEEGKEGCVGEWKGWIKGSVCWGRMKGCVWEGRMIVTLYMGIEDDFQVVYKRGAWIEG